jgi:hypothetical protein
MMMMQRRGKCVIVFEAKPLHQHRQALPGFVLFGCCVVLQVNQVQGMYIEDSDISYAGDNGVDFVAVQYGHVCRSKIHEANWCIYAKGGPAR